ncbi:class I SAM-dependent methyltransferase [Xenorhabdus szentirmaii]|uniref:Methyltransferase type 11 domain-containing protein n=2 Tax=Xenorhabdus szentirmaii TaxID=290112 RepID=W1IYQ0_9GAMM|nr:MULTISPECIES: methyltransferase domain-containing protein [Xenorhabdus]MBD2780356.1 methyltransferase domain-containing protein [Xenorhabdus sp. 38]MBD2793947.1 methyltransferase domain-containing protein [Xenorhabdus sp. CUL]MBD2802478.1 methyltransferase domain-containing protein [Xenorhabdus sp. M]MBD2804289.1 methyltransferase domain-containing protein [Xenorhabdus sp. ZM]MBD2826446.1 methyltransferase domain-containing protein [Xenorhabdus sp. 5]
MQLVRSVKKIIIPDSWAELPWGEYYRVALERQLEPWWPKIFGFHLLKIGQLSTEIDSRSCLISHQVNVGLRGDSMNVITDPHYLPFATKSVDACLLAHLLTYSIDPHWLLREIDRIMIDDGWLIISGFNPMSLAGLKKIISPLSHQFSCNAQMFSMYRQLDWLRLLNYEVIYHANFHALPWQNSNNTYKSVFGCLNVIIARKRTIPLTLNPMRAALLKPKFSNALGAIKNFRRRY